MDALREGLKPLVLSVMEDRFGPTWHQHPRVRRLVFGPPYGPEGPAWDIGLLLKILDDDVYWKQLFQLRLPGISRWVIDSLRELRNRIAHDDGQDPIFSSTALTIQYLDQMERVLQAIASDQAATIRQLRQPLQPGLRQRCWRLLTFRSRHSRLAWAILGLTGLVTGWWVNYLRSPRISKLQLVIGTPQRNLDAYRSLEQALESRLKPANPLQYLLGARVDVLLQSTATYPHAVAELRSRRWDVVFAYSPVISFEALAVGYNALGIMFPDEPHYQAILFSRRGSRWRNLRDLDPRTRVALGDYYSATKFYVPLSMLRSRTLQLFTNLSTRDILDQVRTAQADVGVIASTPAEFNARNRDLQILASSEPLPTPVVALSPTLSDPDRDALHRALLALPAEVRRADQANFGPGPLPNFRGLQRRVAEARVLSACLDPDRQPVSLRCPGDRRVQFIDAWVEQVNLVGDRVRLKAEAVDGMPLTLDLDRPLLEQLVVFSQLQQLRGRRLRATLLLTADPAQPHRIRHPNQLEFLD